MKNKITKIALIIISALILYSCSLTTRVPDGQNLLTDTEIKVNGEKKNDEELNDQLYQLPNSDVLGLHIRLHLYNWANPNPDSSYQAWLERNPKRHERMRKIYSEKQVQRIGESFLVSGISNFFKEVGEPPVLVDTIRTKRSASRLNAYYHKKGYFRTKAGFSIDTVSNKKAKVTYTIETGKPYILDSISKTIQTPALDSLYNRSKDETLIKSGEQYEEAKFTAERERVTNYFRNHGAYTFQLNNFSYIIDTVANNYKANVEVIVDNETVRGTDSTYQRPFRLYKISEVNIYTQNPTGGSEIDSASYKGFNIYSTGKLNYRPKALTDPVFVTPGSTYADFRRTLTYRYLSNLNVFYYPKIIYEEDPADSTGTSLITNIYLKPKDKFDLTAAVDFTHSNIQDFGIQGNLTLSIRNIFRGAEILNLSTRGNIGSSRDMAIKLKG